MVPPPQNIGCGTLSGRLPQGKVRNLSEFLAFSHRPFGGERRPSNGANVEILDRIKLGLLDLSVEGYSSIRGGHMRNESLYNVAKRYVSIIDAMENERDRERLASLEEKRVIWHNRLIDKLKREGIRFKDRDHVTRLAYRIVRDEL
jgi:hypothetical protein